MKFIYKYVLNHDPFQIVKLPTGAKILNILDQEKGWVLYALVDEQAMTYQDREILIRGTGDNADGCEIDRYITSAVTERGLVFHFFKGIDRSYD